MRLTPMRLTISSALLLAAGVAASPVAQQTSPTPLPSRQAPLPPLKNPPGDIPDDPAFVEYRSPRGFALKTPEGWSR